MAHHDVLRSRAGTLRRPTAWRTRQQTRPCHARSLACSAKSSEAQIAAAAAHRRHASEPADHPVPGQPLPSTYRRWVANGTAATFQAAARLEHVPLYLPGPGESLVRMHWAGINGGCETFRARGDHTFARPLGTRCVPLGAEGAGVVVAVGEGVTRTRVGQAVAVNASAAFSEYCTARERLLTPLPGPAADRPPGPEAAVLALSGMTAICALEGIAKMREGDVVVVTAAAGGTGHIAVQLALLAGCHVVAVVGSPAKASALQQLRQHTCSLQIVDRSAAGSGRVDDAVLGLHPGGAHVVFEGVGGLLRAQLLRCLAPGGRFLQIGYISEYPHASPSGPEWQAEQAPHAAGSHAASEWDAAIPTLPSAAELFWGQQDVLGLPGGRSVHGRVWPQDARTLLRCKSRLYRLHYGQGLLDVWSDTSHGLAGLDAVPDAINYMLQGGHVGKVVLNLTPGS